MIVQLRADDAVCLSIFMEGTGKPEDQHEIVGVCWTDSKLVQHTIGRCEAPMIVEKLS